MNRYDEENICTLFAIAGEHGISSITATYNGFGDSGEISNVSFEGKNPDFDLQASVKNYNGDVETVLFETLACDLAMEIASFAHPDFESGNGGNGSVVFDVPARKIHVEHGVYQTISKPDSTNTFLIDGAVEDESERAEMLSLFDEAKKHGISHINASYEGANDEGRYLEITDIDDDVDDNGSFETCVLDMAEALVEKFHNGYEENAGGSGDVIFDMKERSITINHSVFVDVLEAAEGVCFFIDGGELKMSPSEPNDESLLPGAA